MEKSLPLGKYHMQLFLIDWILITPDGSGLHCFRNDKNIMENPMKWLFTTQLKHIVNICIKINKSVY